MHNTSNCRSRIGKSKSAVKWNSKNNWKIMQLPWNTSKHVHRHNYTLVSQLYVGDKILPSLTVNLLGTNKRSDDQPICTVCSVRRCDLSQWSTSHVLLSLLMSDEINFIAHDTTDEVVGRTKSNGYLNIDSASVPTERKFNLLHHTIANL